MKFQNISIKKYNVLQNRIYEFNYLRNNVSLKKENVKSISN